MNLFGSLTKPAVIDPTTGQVTYEPDSGAAAFEMAKQEAQKVRPDQAQLPAQMPEDGSTEPTNVTQSQRPAPSRIAQPSFFQAAVDRQGLADATAPGLTKGGKLLTLLLSGLAGAGRAAGSRTFGEGFQRAEQGPIQQQLGRGQIAQQQQNTANLAAEAQLREAQAQVAGQSVPITMPNGQTVYVPANSTYARGMGAADVTGRYNLGKQALANQGQLVSTQAAHRFIPVANRGLYDAQKGEILPGTETGIPVNDELISEYPQLAPLKGMSVSPGTLLTQYNQEMNRELSAAPKVSSTADTLGVSSTTETHKVLPQKSGGALPTAPAPATTPRPAFLGGAAPKTAAHSTAQTPEQNKESTVDLIGQYRLDPRTVSRLLFKHPDIYGQLQQKYPNFDETTYNAKNSMMTKFTTGKQGEELNAINTVLQHIGILGDAIDALQNGNVQVMNHLGNAIGVQVGKDPVTTFQTIVHRVAPELAKAYVASGGTGGERGADEKDFDPNMSPAQLRSNVATSVGLLRGKMVALENQWNQMPTLANEFPFTQRFITPQAQAVVNKWSPQGQGVGGGIPQGATHIAPGSDGNKYYVDDKGTILGRAQ